MSKTNLIVVATIAIFTATAIFEFQPTVSEAKKNIEPTATPSPRTIKRVPAPIPSPITKRKRGIKFDGVEGESVRARKPRKKQTRNGN